MGVSHHGSDYEEMKLDFKVLLSEFFETDHVLDHVVDGLFSIMNDYGAVSWT